MCLSNSPNPSTFSSLPGVKSVLSGEFLLVYQKIFGGLPGVLQRGVQTVLKVHGNLNKGASGSMKLK